MLKLAWNKRIRSLVSLYIQDKQNSEKAFKSIKLLTNLKPFILTPESKEQNLLTQKFQDQITFRARKAILCARCLH